MVTTDDVNDAFDDQCLWLNGCYVVVMVLRLIGGRRGGGGMEGTNVMSVCFSSFNDGFKPHRTIRVLRAITSARHGHFRIARLLGGARER